MILPLALDRYLERIGYTGARHPDRATLTALHRAHLHAIPYENLDIHLGRPLVLDERQIFAKLVDQRRGGWCYEMNGLFAWALRELGFAVRLLAGAVNRAANGAAAAGNHLTLLVTLDHPFLADVGFGNGFLEPLPLAVGTYAQEGMTFRLTRDGERWVFGNHQHGGLGYDFTLAPQQLADFAAQCQIQQTAPTSGFVRATVCHRFTPDGILSLRGAVLTTVTAAGTTSITITDARVYAAVLAEQFGLHIPAAATLWEQVWARHLTWEREHAAARDAAD